MLDLETALSRRFKLLDLSAEILNHCEFRMFSPKNLGIIALVVVVVMILLRKVPTIGNLVNSI